ncbi:hypothetical protein CYLTODRAFT_426096 [Cylindrobasidium torrendii FP15055 ss-10]|uniref:Uncharacterized protein n=1 Tax=Cylindrobasidium torrendii FP15055 ss-10 TaxID=1314674 RepID=A0A0D7AZX0_9AGAR|nr:hypothetical protein CYLTODRAFT_426096 [Cylindrobasidium torrendii FP15055 ss-10]
MPFGYALSCHTILPFLSLFLVIVTFVCTLICLLLPALSVHHVLWVIPAITALTLIHHFLIFLNAESIQQHAISITACASSALVWTLGAVTLVAATTIEGQWHGFEKSGLRQHKVVWLLVLPCVSSFLESILMWAVIIWNYVQRRRVQHEQANDDYKWTSMPPMSMRRAQRLRGHYRQDTPASQWTASLYSFS